MSHKKFFPSDFGYPIKEFFFFFWNLDAEKRQKSNIQKQEMFIDGVGKRGERKGYKCKKLEKMD